ncbi:MAG: hypothetical protein QNJ90_13920 [Planctomycetota bacterium]|nr:hypothetical protein [Planctomycetota bacterium]
MKLLPILLINAVLVGGGIVIYDQLRDEGPATSYEASGVDPVEVQNLRDRIAALEGRTPGLKATGIDSNLLARLEKLEGRLASREPMRSSAPDQPSSSGSTDGGMAMPELAEGEEPAREDVQRFRRMMEAAEQLRREERERERLLASLKDLEITLSEKQTDQLMTATRDYRRKIGEMWRTAFSGARGPDGDREAAREKARQGMESLREDFAVTINKFIPSGDAQKIVENIGRVGGRGFGGMGRRGR